MLVSLSDWSSGSIKDIIEASNFTTASLQTAAVATTGAACSDAIIVAPPIPRIGQR